MAEEEEKKDEATEEEGEKVPLTEKQMEMAKLREKEGKKRQVDKEEFVTQIATRDIIEEDFEDDTMLVTFETKPDTKRTLKAHRPSFDDMEELLKYVAGLYKLEGEFAPNSIDALTGQYRKLPELAAKYSVDKGMTEDWWKNVAKFRVTVNFVLALIVTAQTGKSTIPEEQLQYFR